MNAPPKVARKKVREMMARKKFKPLKRYDAGRGADIIMGTGLVIMALICAAIPFEHKIISVTQKVIDLI